MTAQCPRPGCATELDGGPVLYRCSTCNRAVQAADLNNEFVPVAAAMVGAR